MDLSSIYLWFGETLRSFSDIVIYLSQNKARNEKLEEAKTLIGQYTASYEEFIKEPAELSKNVDKESQESVFLYFCIKQVIALYEMECQALPIQVFNEFRSAFDHHQRLLVYKDNIHVNKINSHLQRAFLDIIKMTCIFYFERTITINNKFSKTAITYLDSGDYIKNFTTIQNRCSKLLKDAKCNDYLLGNDPNKNKKVRNSYINALLAHKALFSYQEEHIPLLTRAQYQYLAINSMKYLVSFGLGVLASIFASGILHYLKELF